MRPVTSHDMDLPCPVCTEPAVVTSIRHCATHNETSYTLYRCPDCSLQFWSPLEADPSVYEEEGFEAYADYHGGTRPFPRWAKPLFARLDGLSGGALDIGCGDGAVLNALAQAGFDAHGIDLDKKSISVAREKYGLKQVRAMTLDAYADECGRRAMRFDLITFFEVLEHQDDPLTFLGKVTSLGQPGSHIAGSVPNRKRFLARLDRRLSDGDLPPHHFLWFSRESLTALLKIAGFANISVEPVGTLTYRQFAVKLAAVIHRMTAARTHVLSKVFTSALLLLVPAAAALAWVGMRVRPSHLFFRCELADGVRNEIRE